MKILVHYIDFHADNYQGGSGKSFEFHHLVVVPPELKAGNVDLYVFDKLQELAKAARPFNVREAKITIQKMEIFF